jgi:arginine decarboxylase
MFNVRPKRFFLTSGAGEASNRLNAFDAALIQAGIGDTNLIRMSSILPPGAEEIESFEFPKGSLIPLAFGEMGSTEPGALISAAVAVGIPEDPSDAGLIMEHSFAGPPDRCEQIARDMVREGMETVRGLKIREIKSVSASVVVKRAGAVVAAVVLCP